MKVLVDENIPLITVEELRLKRVIQAITKYSEQQWHGLMVVMRDVVQSSWKSRQKG